MEPNPPDVPASAEKTQAKARPLTGAYFWVPRPTPEGLAWDLTTCHDLGVWDAVSHRDFWPYVIEFLAARWGKDAELLKLRLHNNHTGLPRGRVTHPKSGYVIIHGDDAPVADWLKLIKVKFRLTQVKVTPEFTEHERMIGDDPRAVEEALRVNLGFTLPETSFD